MMKGGEQETILGSDGQILFVKRKNVFRSTESRWPREQIAEITVGRQLDADSSRDWALQVVPYPGEGDTRILLNQRDEAELRWVAALLRRPLSLAELPPPSRQTLPPFRERGEQPAGSKVVVEESIGGLTLTVPPLGIGHRSALAFFGTSVVVVTMTAVLAGFIFLAGPLPLPRWTWILLDAVMGLLALGMAGTGLQLAWRRAVLTVTADELNVAQTDPFDSQKGEWSRSELVDVRVGTPSGAAEERPPWALRIYPKQGRPFGFLAGRDAAELQWLATVLRQCLRLPEDSPG
jgi:hypothetical protein